MIVLLTALFLFTAVIALPLVGAWEEGMQNRYARELYFLSISYTEREKAEKKPLEEEVEVGDRRLKVKAYYDADAKEVVVEFYDGSGKLLFRKTEKAL